MGCGVSELPGLSCWPRGRAGPLHAERLCAPQEC